MSWKETDPLRLWSGHKTVSADDNENGRLHKMARFDGRYESSINAHAQQHDLQSPVNGAEARSQFMSRLFDVWSAWQEIMAIKAPQLLLVMGSSVTASYITAKIMAGASLTSSSFWQALRRLPSNPLLLGNIIGCGVLVPVICFRRFIPPSMLDDQPLDERTIFSKVAVPVAGVLFFSGVLLPTLASTFLVCQKTLTSHDNMHDLVEMFTIPREFSRPIWRHLPHMIVFHFVIAAICTLSVLRARNRVLHRLEANPELVQQLMIANTASTTHAFDLPKTGFEFVRQSVKNWKSVIGITHSDSESPSEKKFSMTMPSPVSSKNVPGIFK